MPDLLSDENSRLGVEDSAELHEDGLMPELPDFEEDLQADTATDSQKPDPKPRAISSPKSPLKKKPKSGFIKKLVLGVVITLCLLGYGGLYYYAKSPSFSFTMGLKQFYSGDYERAFQTFLSAAKEGHVKAQAHLGLLYYHGDGVEQNKPEAAAWVLKPPSKPCLKLDSPFKD